ncbi:MAG: PAQR family membrane homeostasis protein TrhA [Methyloceanibacter sp.]|uniref:PAQR family membrane homeostasis protein TrhA n=1 Tax=Methyloceanibacter sp. TaxID=1965321 RepID=UPI003D9B98DF
MFPQYTNRERVADGCIHVIGVTASLVALTALLIVSVKAQAMLWMVALLVYGLALVAMFSCSAGYHLVIHPKIKEVFRRLDHAAIFFMIAGTYTPFILIKMNDPWGLTLLAVVWTMAAIGIAIKLFAPRFLEGLTVALYLVQGWAVLAAWQPLMSALPGVVLTLLMIGGVLYTVGVVFHLWDRLPYQNAIWHGFVLTAASVHYAAVMVIVAA